MHLMDLSPINRRKAKHPFAVATVMLSLTAVACSTPVKAPVVKLNRSPRMGYDITITVENAPGPFDKVSAAVDYTVVNEACVPMTPLVGATLVPRKQVSMDLTPVGNHAYRGHLFADLIQDEDYYGMGVCHWQMIASTATVTHAIVELSPSISRNDILSSNTVKTYFAKASYTDLDMKRVDIGDPAPGRHEDLSRPFTIVLRAEMSKHEEPLP